MCIDGYAERKELGPRCPSCLDLHPHTGKERGRYYFLVRTCHPHVATLALLPSYCPDIILVALTVRSRHPQKFHLQYMKSIHLQNPENLLDGSFQHGHNLDKGKHAFSMARRPSGRLSSLPSLHQRNANPSTTLVWHIPRSRAPGPRAKARRREFSLRRRWQQYRLDLGRPTCGCARTFWPTSTRLLREICPS